MAVRPEDLRRGAIYASATLLGAGMHPRQMASAKMTRVLPGFWTRSDALPTLGEIARVLQETLRPGCLISHQTAAELLRFPLPIPMTHAGGAALHCRGPGGAPRTAGNLVVVHAAEGDREPVPLRGLWLTDPVSTLRDLAPRLTHPDLVACVDALASQGRGALVDRPLEPVREEAESWRGPGSARLRAAVAQARERVWSPMESRFRLLLTAAGFPCPTMNLQVSDPATGQMFVIDMAYEQWMVAIEYDGDGHRTEARQWRRDLHKNEVLHQLGWTVLRASVDDYRHPERFLRRLEHARSAEHPTRQAMSTELPREWKIPRHRSGTAEVRGLT